MGRIEKLMIRRARLQYQLDTLDSGPAELPEVRRRQRGRRRELRERIEAITARINAIRSRRRERQRNAGQRVRRGSSMERGVDGLIAGSKRRGTAASERGARSRARRIQRRARARFGRSRRAVCATCRPDPALRAARATSSDVWSNVGTYEWGVAPYNARCRDFDTDPGDVLDIEMNVRGGPNPPGPTRAEFFIKKGSKFLYRQSPSTGTSTTQFVSPGGRIRVCGYTSTADPYNWDADDDIDIKVKHRRKKPNLYVHGPEIAWDREWVGFGYSVENNRVHRGDATIALYYAKRHPTGDGVAIKAIRSFPIKRDENTRETWDTDGKFRVPFSEMGTPPVEATHLAVAVDIEKEVDEWRESDNVAWRELPKWETDLEIVTKPRQLKRPVTVFVADPSEKGANSTRRVEPVDLVIRAREKIWGQWQPARPNHWIAVRVEASGEDVTGWVYTRHEDHLLSLGPIDIPDDRRHDPRMHYPVPRLDETELPAGRPANEPPYLYVNCEELGHGDETDTVTLRYLPPAITVSETIRAELWRVNGGGQHDTMLHGATVRAATTAQYALRWTRAPDEVTATALKRAVLPDDRQPPLNAKLERLVLRATLNGRPAPASCRVRLRVTPYIELVSPMSVAPGRSPGIKQGTNSLARGWVYPIGRKKKLARGLARWDLKVKSKRKRGIPRLIVPVPASGPHGVPNAQIPKHIIRVKGGRAKALYLPPERGGADDFTAELYDIAKPKRVLATAPRHRIEIKRIEIPVALVPGIMGTRIKMGVPTDFLDNFDFFETDDLTWNPDNRLVFAEVIGTSVEAQARVMDIDGQSDVTILDERGEAVAGNPVNNSTAQIARAYLDGDVVRNDGGCLDLSYGAFGRHFLRESTTGPYMFPLYCLGYDWRQSNIDSGRVLADQLRRVLAQCPTPDVRPIIITHSMGGIVTRCCLKANPDLADRTLAVLHTFQPVTGAAVMYARFFNGAILEGGIANQMFNHVLGDTPEKFATIVSGLASPFELLPGAAYDGRLTETASPLPDWITVEGHGSFGGSAIWSDYTSAGHDLSTLPADGTTLFSRPPAFIHNRGIDPNVSITTLLRRRSDAARDVMQSLGLWKLEGRTWAIAGTGIDTVNGVAFRLGMVLENAATNPHRHRGAGDETVPFGSAIALFPSEHHKPDTPITEATRQFVVSGATHGTPYEEGLPTMPLVMRIIAFNTFGGEVPASVLD